MTAQIFALDRGGFSAYGRCWFDPRCQSAIIQAADDVEAYPISVTFQETVSSVTEDEDGITSTTPSVSGNGFTATLSAIQAGGRVDYLATLASGVKRFLRVQASDRVRADDYGSWIA